MTKLNLSLFHYINNLSTKNHIIDTFMIFMSKYVIYLFIGILFTSSILGIVLKNTYIKRITICSALIIMLDMILVFILGKFYFVNRPFVLNKVHLLYFHKTTSSFPSDHAVITLAIALSILKLNKPLGKIMILFSIIVGFSRVYVGHHYPLDVICGFILAILSTCLLNYIPRKKH
ncbi:phosphatase PAP2 family protein [Clostridium felsineum]|uniref:Undecaprenyl-diphosphatase BcrC n=1 Tax=Clostridium felsineum TaxID=36839 RepID=A0A1S8L0G7_9CLOT|nr:phosphatase PAP2 family protein [Clostridium felsineum]URZ07283.1 Undecaprenyl-diphosphatase BcrC [Clostridium felsineum]URZ12314.1 Undecaprenyl-diphosphatase BcrC [Clostridium felsineum]